VKYEAEFLLWLLDKRYTKRTAETYKLAIDSFEAITGIHDPADATLSDFDRFEGRMTLKKQAPATIAVRISGMKRFFKFCHQRGFIPGNPAEQVEVPRIFHGTPSVLTEEEVIQFLYCEQPVAAARQTAAGNDILEAKRRIAREMKPLRDSAMLALAYECALRSEELGKLRLEALELKRGVSVLSVTGKAARQPTEYDLDSKVVGLLEAYLTRRRLLGIDHPALFPALWGGRGSDPELGISPDAVRKVFNERIKLAGIEPGRRKVTPHILRRSRCTHLNDTEQVDPWDLTVFMRHRSVETTMRYLGLQSSKKISRRFNALLPWNRPHGLFPGKKK
jgi:site-specific recombinase XerD